MLTLTQGSLADFAACRRRFELRYLSHLPWPAAVFDENHDEGRARGIAFHQMVHRHFLGLPAAAASGDAPAIDLWWDRFRQFEAGLPSGRRLPELTLTVPVGSRSVSGRFDLLILAPERAHIYDWKTETRPRTPEQLRQSGQTRLYLALAAAGLAALGAPRPPRAISLTYWYASDPEASATIGYDEAEHRRAWRELEAVVAELERLAAGDGPWPLTDDQDACGRCAYQLFCRRFPGTVDLSAWQEAEAPADLEPWLP